jgi:hypothetical protein
MQELSKGNFGLVMAYLLPGFVTLWGFSNVSATIRAWLGVSPADSPTVGGFLYVTLASLGAGLAVSLVRWAVVDTLHRWTGIRPPRWDFGRLQNREAAFDVLVEGHYRYHQFYGNTLVAMLLVFAIRTTSLGVLSTGSVWLDLTVILAAVLFFAGSRDALRKYYSRGADLLGPSEPTRRIRPRP